MAVFNVSCIGFFNEISAKLLRYFADLWEFLTTFRDTIRPFNSPLMTPRRRSWAKPVRLETASLFSLFSARYFHVEETFKPFASVYATPRRLFTVVILGKRLRRSRCSRSSTRSHWVFQRFMKNITDAIYFPRENRTCRSFALRITWERKTDFLLTVAWYYFPKTRKREETKDLERGLSRRM